MEFKPTLHKLSNGVTVILDSMDLESTAIKVAFNTGSRDETPDIYGITHFCEHMLCKGTKKLPSHKKLKEFIENQGGCFNASTGNIRLQLYGRIIAENTVVLLETFADILKDSLFDEQRIEIEKNVILDELRRAQDANQRKYSNLIFTNLFGFSNYRTLGNEKNIKSFTREKLLDWIHKRISAKNCVICVSGKIKDSDALIKKIEDLFDFLPVIDVSNNKDLVYTPCDKFLQEPSLKNVWIDILFPCIRLDTYENERENIAESKFRRYMSQELNEVVRQQNGLVYGIGTSGFGNEYYCLRSIHTETSPENLERAVALIAKTAHRVFSQDKITEEVLKRYLNIHKLTNADFLESAVRRRDTLTDCWFDMGKLYDFYKINEFDESATVDDVIKASAGFFDGPMSIMTFGADYGNLDLRKIWNDNCK